MRPLVFLLITLLALGWWAVEAGPRPEGNAEVRPVSAGVWRRTRSGWQPLAGYQSGPAFHPPLTPMLLASFQLLVSLAALTALPTPRPTQSR